VTMDLSEQLALSDQNLVATTREWARRIPGSVVLEEQGVLLCRTAEQASSAVLRTGVQAAPPAEMTLARAAAFFPEGGRAYTIISREHADRDLERAAEAAGFTVLVDEPGMVLDHPVAAPQLPGGVELRRATDAQRRADFLAVVAEVFSDWATTAEAVFGGTRGLLSMPHAAGFVAYVGGEAVSAAVAQVSGCVGGVDFVATRAPYRGRGLGEVVTRAASNAGFSLGARMMALNSDPRAEGLYGRIGYVTISQYRRWGYPPDG